MNYEATSMKVCVWGYHCEIVTFGYSPAVLSTMWARLLLNCGFCCAWLLYAILPIASHNKYVHKYHKYICHKRDTWCSALYCWLLCYKNICITINALQLQNDIYGNLFFNLPTLRRRNRNKLDNKRLTEKNNNSNNNKMAFIFTIRNTRYSNNNKYTHMYIRT